MIRPLLRDYGDLVVALVVAVAALVAWLMLDLRGGP